MHEQEANGLDGQSGRQRLLDGRPNARALATLALALAVVLAGCTGFGGPGADGSSDAGVPEGDAATAASGGSSGGDGTRSAGGEGAETGDDWFNLTAPSHYEFALAGTDEATGERVTGRLVYDVSAAADGELTTSVDYRFGGEQFQSSTTGRADELSAPLFLGEAYAPIAALQSVSLMYLFEMGFVDPTVGNRKQSATEDGTQITEVVEERTYAGLECSFVRTTLDGEVVQEGCIRGSEGGIAPYAATYTDEGELELEVELVEFERR